VIEGTIIFPSLEEFQEQELSEDRAWVEKTLYGDDVLEIFDSSIDEKIKMDARIAIKHKRKKECCTIWSKQSDGLGRHYTKKTNPCNSLDCPKCNPSKINNYRKAIYNKYGPVININYAAKFQIKTNDDIDRAFELRTYWRQVCAAEGRTKVSVQVASDGIILISNEIDQVKIPDHLLNKEHGINNENIEIISLENNSSSILGNFDEFAKKCVYFEVPQDVADHWFRKYNGHKKILHVGREIFKRPVLRIACAEVNVKDAKGLVQPIFYAQTYHSKHISENEAKHLSTAVYTEIYNPSILYGLNDGSYVSLENFVNKIAFGKNDPYVSDWLMYFGRGEKSIALLLKIKEKYEKKNDIGG
jgi:hypothetical protein